MKLELNEQKLPEEALKFEPRSGAEVAELVSKIYELAGPELGCRFVEPNVVLTLAGMKGRTDIHWIPESLQLHQGFRRLEKALQADGIFMNWGFATERDTDIGITNPRGLQRAVSLSRIPGTPAPETIRESMSIEELFRWHQKLIRSLKQAQKKNKIPKEVEVDILCQGIPLGYPDQAIADFEHCYRNRGDFDTDMMRADILSIHPKAQEYHGAIPEFSLYPEHKDDPRIAEYVATCREILKEFYSSEWFTAIDHDSSFRTAVDAANQYHAQEMQKASEEFYKTDKYKEMVKEAERKKALKK